MMIGLLFKSSPCVMEFCLELAFAIQTAQPNYLKDNCAHISFLPSSKPLLNGADLKGNTNGKTHIKITVRLT